MRQITAADAQTAESLFDHSIYKNSHLGWLSLWDLPDIRGSVFTDDKTLIGLQAINSGIVWLHSFYSTDRPVGLDLLSILRSCLPQKNYSVYTISTNRWYSDLLLANGFSKCDEIIQLETDNIKERTQAESHSSNIHKFQTDLSETIRESCEAAFPPVWRLGSKELEIACRDSNYRRAWFDDENPAGYILADINEENCHIQRLAVRPEYQRKGIASALLFRMIEESHALGITNFSVNTNKKNSASVQLYQSLNFSVVDSGFPVFHCYIRGSM